MAGYYNEIDPFCVEWLKNLIAAKLIAAGDVDSRSITEVTADDVKGYTQCHFFAGIAGWSYALRLAGIPDDADVWTGSCPCQPFSNAGKRKGFDDERHLWPEFARLVGDCRPSIVFGEQVASKVGREWLSVVRSDLEAVGYAVGAADLCAASVGAPHIRQRLWWVADTRCAKLPRFIAKGSGIRCVSRAPSTERGNYGVFEGFYNESSAVPFVETDGFRRPVGQVRAAGNAIVPQVAAEFIAAAMEYAP